MSDMTYDIPGASVYGQAVALAKQRYQTRLADINKQRQSTMRTAGFQGDIDPETGLVKNMRIDPYNQYGQYQQLNRAQALQGIEVEGQNISRGLGARRGGLGAQSMADARYGWGQQDAAFGANLADMLAGFDRMQAEEKYGYDQALWQAQQLAAQSAIAAEDYGAPDDGYDYPYPGGGAAAPPGGALLDLLSTINAPGVRNIVYKPPPPPKTTKRPRPRGAGGTTYRSM
jgi:hypothetical protein